MDKNQNNDKDKSKDKVNPQPQSAKQKNRSSLSFFCCGSTTKKKKKPNNNPNHTNTNSNINNNNSHKIESNESSINQLEKNKEKNYSNVQDVIFLPHKLDNSSNNTMIVSSAEKTSNHNTENKIPINDQQQSKQPKLSFSQIKDEQIVMPIKEEDIHLDVNKSIQISLNKSNNAMEPKLSINPIIDPFCSQEINQQVNHNENEEVAIEEIERKSKGNQIKQNLKDKFNDNRLESNTSEYYNKGIAMTEHTPRRVNNPFTQVINISDTVKEIQSTRDPKGVVNPNDKTKANHPPVINTNISKADNNCNVIKPSNTNETNVMQSPIGGKVFVETNTSNRLEGIEFGLKKKLNDKDTQSINNELIHKQIDIKQMNSSMIVNKNNPEKITFTPFTHINNNQLGKVYQTPIKPDLNIASPNFAVKTNESVNINTKSIISNNNNNSNVINQIQQPQSQFTDQNQQQLQMETKQSLNYINNNLEEEDSKGNLTEENNYCDEGDDIRSNKETISKYSENHSVISSYVFTVPRMISGINDSYAPSVYTRSEYKETTSNFLPTESSNNLRIIPTTVDDTEFEITNENGEGFRNFIETPRTSNVNFRKSNREYSNVNPQFKEIYDKINHKEKEIKRMNEKITKLMSDIQKCEEENKKYDRWFEKEESDGEMLRHMLNFLNSKQ